MAKGFTAGGESAVTLAWAFLTVVCSVIVVYNLPVNYIEIRDGDETVLASPVAAGSRFETFYVHSLELTPVIDEYRIVGGRVWTWEERVRSHGAGLPYAAPEHGSLVMAPPWMIVRGGRIAMDRIAYRVGAESLGRNRISLPPFAEIRAYETYRSKRLLLVPQIKRLSAAPVIGFKRGDSK
jgi:hypothetical protein